MNKKEREIIEQIQKDKDEMLKSLPTLAAWIEALPPSEAADCTVMAFHDFAKTLRAFSLLVSKLKKAR